jgi:hypothetical protein
MVKKKLEPRHRLRGWVESKVLGAAIKAELVPLMQAAGWTPIKDMASRKYTYWWGRFCFERASPWQVELLDIGYKYGWRARENQLSAFDRR